jgi:hypothetical protein
MVNDSVSLGLIKLRDYPLGNRAGLTGIIITELIPSTRTMIVAGIQEDPPLMRIVEPDPGHHRLKLRNACNLTDDKLIR